MSDICVNGEMRRLEGIRTISQLLEELKLPAQTVAVEVNLQLVPRVEHSQHELRAGDQIEIVTFKGGG